MVPAEEEDALAEAAEEAVVVLVAVEEEGAVVVDDVPVAAVEEEDAVAACVVAEVWLGAPKSSTRRLLFGLLTCMARGNFLLAGMFSEKKNFVKTLNHTHKDLTSTMQATKMQRARPFLYTGSPLLTGLTAGLQLFEVLAYC